jgi:SAM-dependent MidA family methyltransferase
LSAASLPPPAPEALAHSRALCAEIRAAIAAAGGRIAFSRYLELALYAPGLGYYSAGSAKFGPQGDFVTAPEISTLFGQTLAAGIAPTLDALAQGVVLELGAGSGALAVAVMRELAAREALPREYWILEVSGDLRARQRAAIDGLAPALAARVRWIDALPEVPFEGVVLANEVLDALPFERFRVLGEGRFHSAWVEATPAGFVVVFDTPPPELGAALAELAASLGEAGIVLAAGYESELCPALRPFVFMLGERLARGLVLLSDYGTTRRELYLPERERGTFLCHYRHRAHDDPFFLPGLQDITAWVDFTAVADAGVDAGLAVTGYTTQAHFLLGSGLDEVLGARLAAEPGRAPMLQSEAKTLTLPGEMGERFKFLGLARDLDVRPRGFALRDLAASL